MFKSVFAQYIVAFVLIVLVSFTMLITTIASIMANYSYDVKSDIISNASSCAQNYVNELMEFKEYADADSMITHSKDFLSIMLGALTTNSDEITVLVSNEEGKVLMSVGEEAEKILGNAMFPDDITKVVDTVGEYNASADIEAIMPGRHLVHATAFTDAHGNKAGYIMVTSVSALWTNFFDAMIKAIIIACLWIMLATLIAVYFISERVSEPLKQMSKAVKSYASGDFDTRVPVSGSDEVAELATAFNNMADSLDNLEKLRNGFIANVSHDLRTPMTTIIGFVDGILDGVIPPEKYDYYLGVISSEVRRLSRLVSSLLDISKMEAGERKFVMKPFDICEMGRQIVISFEQKLEAKQLDVEFECDDDSMMVCADHDAIYQIFYNLCDNAVKFSFEKAKYRVSIKDEKNKKIKVSVYNEGEGIPAEDLPFVFERFYKSDKSRGLDKTGLGLGLYISKTIIEAHGEEISVNSEKGKYCEFVFTLPKATPNIHGELEAKTEKN